MNTASPLLRAALPEKKPFPKDKAFRLVLALSLALNVYFLFFQKESDVASVAEASLAQPSSAVETPKPAKPVNKKEELQPEPTVPQVKSVANKPSEIKPVARKPDTGVSPRRKEKPEFTVKKVAFTTSPQGDKQTARSLTFKIKNSLNYSVCNIMTVEEGCRQLSAHIGRLLAWNMDMNRQARKGDMTSVIYETLDEPEKFHILKLKYKSAYHHKTFEANYYQVPGRKYGAYFDTQGREIHPRLANAEAPIRDYIEITSLPGDYRKGRFRGHRGTDFKAPTGTPIYAAFDGKVTRRNWNVRSNGYSLEIDHPSRKTVTRYLHLSRTLVKPGTVVKQGQKIAESGNTGHSFAPHLHYEIQDKRGRAKLLNPFKSAKHKTVYLSVPEPRHEDYRQRVASYDAMLQNG